MMTQLLASLTPDEKIELNVGFANPIIYAFAKKQQQNSISRLLNIDESKMDSKLFQIQYIKEKLNYLFWLDFEDFLKQLSPKKGE